MSKKSVKTAKSEISTKQVEKKSVECSGKKKERNPEEYKALMHRLNRIEGQIKGIKKMLENDAYCLDILVQVSAANAALGAFSKILLLDHIQTCVVDDIKAGNKESINELCTILQKLMK